MMNKLFAESKIQTNSYPFIRRESPLPKNGGAPSISGAPTNGNTYLVNGADSRFDNVRSDAADTVIEDAIQETTVLTAGVSAEYGQFSGGVISTITKSGGNAFTGTFRSAFSNPDWVARNPLEIESEIEKEDTLNHVETVTIGGPVIKDRLWFFVAAEKTELDIDLNYSSAQTISARAAESYGIPGAELIVPGIRKVEGRADERENYKIKLSGQISPGHDVIVSYQDREDVNINNTSSSYDFTATASRTVVRDALSVNYRGLLNASTSLDLLYTDRESNFLEREVPPHLQGLDLRIYGTQLRNRSGSARTNSPTFLGKPDEPRGNETYSAKVNYFLTTSKGSHDVVFGVQQSTDTRYVDNRQTANDWQFRSDWRFDEAGNAIPIFSPTSSGGRYRSRLYYYPIELGSQTYEFEVASAYINDVWHLNENWRFNIGFRYDKNDGKDQQGTPVADDSHISPRLSANWDIFGDRQHQVSMSYSEYVQRTSEAADDTSQAGSPSLAILNYGGPQTEDYLQVIQWINDTYGEGFFQDPLNHPNRAQWEADLATNQLYQAGSPVAIIGAINPNGGGIPGSLDSLVAKELRLGYNQDWGLKGYVKADWVYREYSNFAVSHINRTTGPTNNGATDLAVINNDDDLYERTYNAVQLQGAFQLSNHLNLAGNYTWSRLTGNADGEASDGVGTSAFILTEYPEFNSFERRNPVGYLANDQRHKANLFLTYDVSTGFGNFTISAFEEISSGTPYQLAWTLDYGENGTEDYGLPALNGQGYVSPDDTAVYYLDLDAGRGDTAFATHLGLNYSVKVFRKVELFVQMDVFNLFNQDTADNGLGYNTTVNEIAPFLVNSEAPVLNTHYELGPDYGTPTLSSAYQRPRTFNIDIGFRF